MRSGPSNRLDVDFLALLALPLVVLLAFTAVASLVVNDQPKRFLLHSPVGEK